MWEDPADRSDAKAGNRSHDARLAQQLALLELRREGLDLEDRAHQPDRNDAGQQPERDRETEIKGVLGKFVGVEGIFCF